MLFATWYDGLAPLAGRCAAVGRGLRPSAARCARKSARRWSRCAPPARSAPRWKPRSVCAAASPTRTGWRPLADELRFLFISGDVEVLADDASEGHRRARHADQQDQMRALLALPRGRRRECRRIRSCAGVASTNVGRRTAKTGGGSDESSAGPAKLKPTNRRSAWLLLSVVVIALDQWSKIWVLTSLPEFTAVPVIEGFWNWYRTYNTGAAFSFLSDAGGWQKYFFVVLAFGISGLLGCWLARTPRRDWRTALPYSLVIGGAIGNVIDRLHPRQRDRLHPVVLARPLLAGLQHRRLGDRRRCGRHRPVRPARWRSTAGRQPAQQG